jgi:hypothetical protein
MVKNNFTAYNKYNDSKKIKKNKLVHHKQNKQLANQKSMRSKTTSIKWKETFKGI